LGERWEKGFGGRPGWAISARFDARENPREGLRRRTGKKGEERVFRAEICQAPEVFASGAGSRNPHRN